MGYRVHCEDCFVNLLKNETPSQLEHVLMNYAYPSEKKKQMISGGYLEDTVSSAQPPVISYWLRVFLVAACRVRNLPNPFSGKKNKF
jgi:hypothetical protein